MRLDPASSSSPAPFFHSSGGLGGEGTFNWVFFHPLGNAGVVCEKTSRDINTGFSKKIKTYTHTHTLINLFANCHMYVHETPRVRPGPSDARRRDEI